MSTANAPEEKPGRPERPPGCPLCHDRRGGRLSAVACRWIGNGEAIGWAIGDWGDTMPPSDTSCHFFFFYFITLLLARLRFKLAYFLTYPVVTVRATQPSPARPHSSLPLPRSQLHRSFPNLIKAWRLQQASLSAFPFDSLLPRAPNPDGAPHSRSSPSAQTKPPGPQPSLTNKRPLRQPSALIVVRRPPLDSVARGAWLHPLTVADLGPSTKAPVLPLSSVRHLTLRSFVVLSGRQRQEGSPPSTAPSPTTLTPSPAPISRPVSRPICFTRIVSNSSATPTFNFPVAALVEPAGPRPSGLAAKVHSKVFLCCHRLFQERPPACDPSVAARSRPCRPSIGSLQAALSGVRSQARHFPGSAAAGAQGRDNPTAPLRLSDKEAAAACILRQPGGDPPQTAFLWVMPGRK